MSCDFCPNPLLLLVAGAPFRAKFSKKHSKIFFSETVQGIKPVLCIHVPDSGLYIICVFIPGG